MEAILIIKLPDGSTKTIELQNVNVSTSWGMPSGSPITTIYGLESPPPTPICTLSLGGQVKDTSLNTAV
jgi:hypothetical protein